MKITHIMADGTIRESVDGLVIKSKDFYQTLNNIQQKKNTQEIRKMIGEIFVIVILGLCLASIGYPFVEAFSRWKKGMEEDEEK